MSDEAPGSGSTPWQKIPSWALPVMYVMGGGTLGFGGMSLTIDRGEEEGVSGPAEQPPEPTVLEEGGEEVDLVEPVEPDQVTAQEQELKCPDPVACDSSIADSLRDQLLDTRTQLTKCKVRRRSDD